jgi:hypothetical protein
VRHRDGLDDGEPQAGAALGLVRVERLLVQLAAAYAG